MNQEVEPPVTQGSPALLRHRSALLAWFRRRLRDTHEAEDLCQETIARFLARAPELDDAAKTGPYLFRTARNLLFDHLRRRRPPVDPDALDMEPAPEASSPDLHAAEARVFQHELQARLQSLLRTLPADQRQAFELGVLLELPYAEISRQQGWSVAKVKVDVYRARKALIEGLRPFVSETGPRARSSSRSLARRKTP